MDLQRFHVLPQRELNGDARLKEKRWAWIEKIVGSGSNFATAMPSTGTREIGNFIGANKDRYIVSTSMYPRKWRKLQKSVARSLAALKQGRSQMKQWTIPIVAIAFCLFFGARSLEAQTLYEVEGTVYGPDSKGMANVTVTLQNHAGAQIDQDITKTDGRYRFAGVIAGTYYISVKPSEPGVQQLLQKIELINTGVSVTNFSKERFDFSLNRTAASERPSV